MSTNKLSLVAMLIASCFLLVSCGQETVGDTAAREQNRQRERQNLFNEQNKIIAGVYQGETDTADLFLILKATKMSNGDVTPDPTVSGILILAPKIDTNNERPKYTYTFLDGSYDPLARSPGFGGGNLSGTFEKATLPSNFSCDVTISLHLSCKWDVTMGAQLEFHPVSKTALSVLSQKRRTKVEYKGKSEAGADVTLEFQSGVIPVDASKVPIPAILGQLTWHTGTDHPVLNYFKNGTYDPVTGKIVLVLDDDSSGNMECSIIDEGQSLECVWNGLQHHKFTFVRSAKR
jgi:hypothetical protein